MIIEEIDEEFELDKRTYLPFILKINCTCCNKELVKNLSTHYLSYPIVNSEQTIHFYCEECDVSIEEKVKFTVKLEQV